MVVLAAERLQAGISSEGSWAILRDDQLTVYFYRSSKRVTARFLIGPQYHKLLASMGMIPFIMQVHFKDAYGKSGRISESLEVTYSGRWEEEVEDFVGGLKKECSDQQTIEGETITTHILLELPDVAPIVEVRRSIVSE